MLRILYDGDVAGGEPVTAFDLKEVRTVRVKSPNGKYAVVVTDLDDAGIQAHPLFAVPVSETPRTVEELLARIKDLEAKVGNGGKNGKGKKK